MEKESCKKSELIVNIRNRELKRFKAGSELSGKVNLVSVDYNEDQDETHEIKEIKLTFSSEACVLDSSIGE